VAAPAPIGFIGLGNMGRPMAACLAAGGVPLLVHDAAGTAERAPEGAETANSTAKVAACAETVFLSLPDGASVMNVAAEIIEATARATTLVVDLSTTGIEAARATHAILETVGVGYLDAPVSGGVAGAVAGTISVMVAGPRGAFDRLRPVFDHFTGNAFHVGEVVGQGQAMKLANNFLSATAMAATSEAILFGEANGLDMVTMLAVINASTGRNMATSDKFPRRVLTGTFDAGFTSTLIAKDVRLYMEGVGQAGTRAVLGPVVSGIIDEMDAAMPGADFTRIYTFTAGKE
jgi:3-hydroxyisobutyrate dehydrogenase